MIGRLEKTLVLNGGGSSPHWAQEVEQRNVPIGLPIRLQQDSYLPTDTTSFSLKRVPVLCAFSGVHDDYHTPGDTPDKINYGGAQQIARFMMLITRSLAEAESAPEYRATQAPEMDRARGGMRAYLGTLPDYAETDLQGVKLDGVTEGAPAAVAGVQAGDVIVELAGQKIENVYDYTYAIQALKVGETVPIVVLREGERVSLEITPGSRE
jgi:C-terminal processing protease CtpA/Prc